MAEGLTINQQFAASEARLERRAYLLQGLAMASVLGRAQDREHGENWFLPSTLYADLGKGHLWAASTRGGVLVTIGIPQDIKEVNHIPNDDAYQSFMLGVETYIDMRRPNSTQERSAA